MLVLLAHQLDHYQRFRSVLVPKPVQLEAEWRVIGVSPCMYYVHYDEYKRMVKMLENNL